MSSKVQKIKFSFSSSKLYFYRIHYWLLKVVSVVIAYFVSDFLKNKLVPSEEGKVFAWLDIIKYHPNIWVPAIAIGAGLLIFLFFGSLINWFDQWLTFSFNSSQILTIIKDKKITLFGNDYVASLENIFFNSNGNQPIVDVWGVCNLSKGSASKSQEGKDIRLFFRSVLPASFLTDRSLADDLVNAFPEVDIKLKDKKIFWPVYYQPFFFVAKVVFWVLVGIYAYSLNKELESKDKNFQTYLKEQAAKVDIEKYEKDKAQAEAEKKKQEEEAKIMYRPIPAEQLKVGIDDFGGYEKQKQKLRLLINSAKNGSPIARSILLWGPPGTGKTMVAKAIAKELGLPYFATTGIEFKPSWEEEQKGVRTADKKMREFFKTASAYAKEEGKLIVCFVDELNEAVGTLSKATGREGSGRELLPILDEINKSYDNIIFIATANWPSWFDDAVLRSGRLDQKICIPIPDSKDLKEIIKVSLKKYAKNFPADVNGCDPSKFAERFTDLAHQEWVNKDFVGADVDAMIRKLKPWKDSLIRINKAGNSNVLANYGYTEEIIKTALKDVENSRFNRAKEQVQRESANKRQNEQWEEYFKERQEEEKNRKPKPGPKI